MSKNIVCDKCGKVWDEHPPVFAKIDLCVQSSKTLFYTNYHGHLCKDCLKALLVWGDYFKGARN